MIGKEEFFQIHNSESENSDSIQIQKALFLTKDIILLNKTLYKTGLDSISY